MLHILMKCIEGKVATISDRGASVRYDVATGREEFVVLQAKRDYLAAGIAVGQGVVLSFDPAAAHVFRWEGGDGNEVGE